MPTTLHRSGFTFAVDQVTQTDKPLPERKTHDAVKRVLDSEIESCSDYSGSVVAGIGYQPLLAAVYTAFNEHRPLTLSPDAVWITIAQGVGHHMAIHAERLRSRFVAHEGKMALKFLSEGWVPGSPENPWPEAFASWSNQIREHVGAPLHDVLVCDFSTTGPVERTVSQIVMMDIFERYFHYVAYGVCGIPSITLEGTCADWERLANKVAGLRVFDMDWWLEHLRPICQHFARASRGDVDLSHWRSICKLQDAYGGDIINGWVGKLFPYLRAFARGPCDRRNPIFETGEGFTTAVAPSGLSTVPFTWDLGYHGYKKAMEAIGGLVGMTQDPQSLALRPKVGWAVREAGKLGVLLDRLTPHMVAFPGSRRDRLDYLPPDLAGFYHRTNGAELFGRGTGTAIRVVQASEFQRLAWNKPMKADPSAEFDLFDIQVLGDGWYRLAWLADGSELAMYPYSDVPDSAPARFHRKRGVPEFERLAAICHCDAHTQGQPGKNPVVALTFTELLERLLDSGGRPYWLDANFVNYGDAELYG